MYQKCGGSCHDLKKELNHLYILRKILKNFIIEIIVGRNVVSSHINQMRTLFDD